jgi:hypothetical protein
VLYTPHATPAQSLLRHRCRNPRCGGKLETPTDNPRHAFCCHGCFDIFYRARCLVCERPIDRKTDRRKVCKRSECRHEFQRHPERFSCPRYPASVLGHNASGSAHFTGLKSGSKSGRPFRLVAGPALTDTGFRLATIPLDLGLAARLDRAHADHIENRKKARRAAARRAQIKRRHPPVNVLGGYQFPNAPEIDLSPVDSPEWAIPSRWKPTGDGADVPDIPEFLRRSAPEVLVVLIERKLATQGVTQ